MKKVLGILRNPVVLVVLALGVGLLIGRRGGEPATSGADGPAGGHAAAEAAAEKEPTVWTCSMHPQIQLPAPGKCPICFMDLIPVERGVSDDASGAPRLEMSESARALAEIRTAPVVRDRPTVEVRLVGKVDYDETRNAAITAWVPGRLDQLYVDYTGIQVRKGDHLAEIYSPDLVSAQEELLQALRTQRETSSAATPRLREAADGTVEAAREKLELLGVTDQQIRALEKGDTPSDHITLYAQTGGVVIEKNAVEGDYVRTGTAIYRIADLTHVWVKLDAYESDLAWLRFGQEVQFTAEALPGRTFAGRVSFVAPTLDPKTRTVKVRVNVDNADRLLKPEMFVRATVLAEVDAEGHVVADDLAGKWICPMHPEVIKDRPGACDICGMDLVTADELGYVTPPASGRGALVIPRTAVLFTGKRAIVYVEVPDAEHPTYEGREIVLGPRAGDVYLVNSGLEEGERVVVKGNFKIDSALQIQAKPSMMSPPEESAHAHDGPLAGAEFAERLDPLYAAYFAYGRALAGDDGAAAHAAIRDTRDALEAVKTEDLSAAARDQWKRMAGDLTAALDAPGKDADLDAIRPPFEKTSAAVLEVARVFGHAGEEPFHVIHCPMAFGRGADWLQDHDTVDNPYYGAKMLRCGEAREELAGT
ncbi:MAG TPA: efflux RND transporter periplasmic adaptor subunit, partial [bacterium]|nr:efflux RND transporter periplasmic adaptor subunit [bacterium]